MQMRDLSWKVFAKTGDVDAYMLYKEIDEEKYENDAVNEPEFQEQDVLE